MVKVFDIFLDPPLNRKGFSAGSRLTGRVVVEVDEAKAYRQIEISFVGCGKVEWSKGSGEDSETHRAREEYLCEAVIVWGHNLREEEGGTLPAGHHEFPFVFSIPESCPSSYETKGGSSRLDAWIRYTLTGRISTKGALKADHTTEKRVTVTREQNLGQAHEEPVRLGSQEYEGCLWCVSGPVDLTVEIPRSGFNVGDKIPLSVSLENGSSHSPRVEASLVKKVKLKAQSHLLNKSPQKVVCECSDQCRAGSTTTWDPQTLIVPDVHATMETPGGMIKISYEVSVCVGLRFGKRVEVGIPVSIVENSALSKYEPTAENGATLVTVTSEQYQPWNT